MEWTTEYNCFAIICDQIKSQMYGYSSYLLNNSYVDNERLTENRFLFSVPAYSTYKYMKIQTMKENAEKK